MSTAYNDIRAALTTRLQAMTGLPAVAWEGKPYSRATGTTYIQPYVLIAEPTQAEIGLSGANRQAGVYHINVFIPAGAGIGAGLTLADTLCTWFKRGTQMTYNCIVVTSTKAFISPALTEPDWLQIPVQIRFNSLIPN